MTDESKNMENETCCQSWKSPRAVIAILGVLLLGAVIIVSILRDRIVNQPQNQVSFTGQGKVYFEPDIANLNLGVKVDKKAKAEEALNELNGKIKKILAAIEKSNVPKIDIQTQSYSLVPHYDFKEETSQLTGYDANQIIIVKIRDIKNDPEKLSNIVKAATEAGANQINGVSFEPGDLEAIKQEARVKAIADAKTKASNLSKEIGVKLGEVVGWWENYNPYIYQPYYGEGGGYGGGGGSPMIPNGNQEVIIEVTINYKVK